MSSTDHVTVARWRSVKILVRSGFIITLCHVFTWTTEAYDYVREPNPGWCQVCGCAVRTSLLRLFVQAKFQESRFIWATWWELFGCLDSCRLAWITRLHFWFLFRKITKELRVILFQCVVHQMRVLKDALIGSLGLNIALINFQVSIIKKIIQHKMWA